MSNSGLLGRSGLGSTKQELGRRVFNHFRILLVLLSVLFSTGIYNQATWWGHEVVGLSNTDILTLTRVAAASSGIHQAMKCLTSTVRFCLSLRKHPWLRTISDTFRLWFKVIANFTHDARDLHEAWKAAREELASRNNNISYVRGLLSNIVRLLKILAWQPVHEFM